MEIAPNTYNLMKKFRYMKYPVDQLFIGRPQSPFGHIVTRPESAAIEKFACPQDQICPW